jgi:hypothetical protein
MFAPGMFAKPVALPEYTFAVKLPELVILPTEKLADTVPLVAVKLALAFRLATLALPVVLRLASTPTLVIFG